MGWVLPGSILPASPQITVSIIAPSMPFASVSQLSSLRTASAALAFPREAWRRHSPISVPEALQLSPQAIWRIEEE